jgi:hypothetical protein
MLSKDMQPIIEIEPATAEDILDGLNSLSGNSSLSSGFGQGVLVPPPGEGPDTLLNWAIQEVTLAMQPGPATAGKQCCIDAVTGARRALACCVDWYLQRDLAHLCRNPPATPKEQVKFLIGRGVIDELTSRVLERAIEKRNVVEHRYVSPSLDVAEDVVELIRRTMTAIRAQSPPEQGRWLFGCFYQEIGFGEQGRYAAFHGWRQPFAVCFLGSEHNPGRGLFDQLVRRKRWFAEQSLRT